MYIKPTSFLFALFVAACSPAADEAVTPATEEVSAPKIETLGDAVAAAWRSPEEKARDPYRHPEATLDFFGIAPSDTVIEIWPGGGWYTNVIAPYLASGGGQFIAAHWDVENASEDRKQRLSDAIDRYIETYSDPDIYGEISITAFSASSGPLAAPESADAVLSFRNVHNWMAGDYAAKLFEDAFDVLKPGGTLGIVEHRLPSSEEQDPRARSGYVHEDFVKSLAEAAGFEFVASSEVNANPADTADHPFGVWTLPPVSRSTGSDGTAPEGFDPSVYAAIGESDRMTLKFVKPAPDSAAAPEDSN